MKIEKLRTNKITSKGVILGLVIGVSLIIVINLLFSYSKFKAEDSVDLAEGTINYVIPDLKLMAVYVKNEKGAFEKKDTVPSDTTYQVVKGEGENTSYCVDPDGNKLDNVYMKYHDGKILIDVNKKGTKCWVYLEKATLLNKDVLAKNKPKESTYNATYPYIAEFTSTSTTDEGVYSMVDYDGEPTYYFRGAVTDNYVHFAGFYWRIIRINSDGSIRMIYDGTSAHANGEATDDKKTSINSFSAVAYYDDAKYVGFMYGGVQGEASNSYIEATRNETKSSALNNLENWYGKNLVKYENYLEKNAIFCNDRRSSNVRATSWLDWLAAGSKNSGGFGGGDNLSFFGAMKRLHTSHVVDLSCQSNDRFTPTDATRGNKAMQYPVGLISIDEVVMAGGFESQANNKYYLYGVPFWTMSPIYFDNNLQRAYVYVSDTEGKIGGSDTRYVAFGNRPVINLKANTTFSKGDGSINSPYEII